MGCCGSSERFALRVLVVSAEGLPDVDWVGKCDPYVEVIYKDETLKTEVIKNNQSPVWNKEFTIEGAKLKAEPIKFNMTDWDRFTKDDFIGTATISTDDQPEAENTQKEYTLELMKGVGSQATQQGTLKVKIEFLHTNS
mmetsp:Transcript_18156/g.22302  ORF Transcript_18156/g.22302 Transcript_18156/m.22302 type:complete len:139 (-) Transcript_18156:162-578(-)